MGSALLNTTTIEESAPQGERTSAPGSADLRQEVAERLAAHRGRRHAAQVAAEAAAGGGRIAGETQKSRIAAAVAERYAQAQTYRAFLADEAERAVQQARAAAEVAARNAKAVAAAQEELLQRLAREASEAVRPAESGAGTFDEGGTSPGAPGEARAMLWPEMESDSRPEPPGEGRAAELELKAGAAAAELQPVRVVLYEEIRPLPRETTRRTGGTGTREDWDDPEAWALDEEISFRQAPVFEEPAGPPMPLAANLIEFPRQLVAPRKARPRYAEGPLRDEDGRTPDGSQLRIFEVESGQIATVPKALAPEEAQMAQWTSLWLDGPGGAGRTAEPEAQTLEALNGVEAVPYFQPPARPVTAALSRRALAAAVDGGIAGAAWLVLLGGLAAGAGVLTEAPTGWSVAAVAERALAAAHGLPLGWGAAAAVGSAAVLGLGYHLLFFTFSDATPGMRWARVGLCTFSDENPSRRAMRRRLLAVLLSTVCLGLGFGWALLDEDRLSWHDLISRMYPRSY